MKKLCLISLLLLINYSCNSNKNINHSIKYSRIDRTLGLLNNHQNKSKTDLYILFYGQSIIGGMKTDILVDSLKKLFPDVNIKSENKAIGGFTVPSLIKTAEHDLYISNPDLIIFHAYDGIKDGLFDSIIKNIRSRMSSDILLFDHHYVWDKPKTKLESINNSHDYDSKEIENIANKYECYFVNVREKWRDYLVNNDITPNQLMGNTIDPNVHPNDKGNELLRSILLSAFKSKQTNQYHLENDLLRELISIPKNSKEFNLKFEGNRLILKTNRRHNKESEILVYIDNKSPSEIKSNYHISRPSEGLNSWMPAIKKVSFGETFPREEEWTVEFFNIDRSNKTFNYRLSGSITGLDGIGSSNENFISNSKRIKIEKENLNIFKIEDITHKETPENFLVKFEMIQLVSDTIILQRNTSDYLIYRGIESGSHNLSLKVLSGNPELESILVLRPFLN